MRLVVMLCALLGAALSAHAADLPQPQAAYQARFAMTVDGQSISGRLYADGPAERREFAVDGMDQVLIITDARDEAFMLQPAMGMALRLDVGDTGPDLSDMSRFVAEAEGTEEIVGLTTTRYRVTGTTDGSDDFVGHLWATDDGIYARIEGQASYDGRQTDLLMALDDIRRGPQDPALFQVPPGMQVLSMDEMMEQMQQLLNRQ